MTGFTHFVCNDMEAAWIAQLCADGEREMAEWERQEDIDHEEHLARQAVLDGDAESWPSYADAPFEVVDPDIVVDADLAGLPVQGDDEYFDDELDVESVDEDAEEDA